MCAVSMITDYYRDKWNPFKDLDFVQITKAQWEEYQELKRRMAEYDARTNQPDCAKPEVEVWERMIEDLLKKRGILKD